MKALRQRPPGLDARVSYSTDGGQTWKLLGCSGLPERYDRVPVVLFAAGSAWVMTDKGGVFRAADPSGEWTLAHQLGAPINAASAGGSPSSVESGFAR